MEPKKNVIPFPRLSIWPTNYTLDCQSAKSRSCNKTVHADLGIEQNEDEGSDSLYHLIFLVLVYLWLMEVLARHNLSNIGCQLLWLCPSMRKGRNQLKKHQRSKRKLINFILKTTANLKWENLWLFEVITQTWTLQQRMNQLKHKNELKYQSNHQLD